MANIIEILIKANNEANDTLDSALDKLSGVGKSMQDIGKKMTVATAPIALALGVAVNSAMQFDSSMTNVASVLGKNRSEMAGLNREVLKIGAASRAGPQAAAEAFYDIAGGVADANSHMAILQASIATAEAGSADLGSTTNALIAVMNSYGFAADDAAYASDVLTRTVGMGVGSMGDFASALPSVTGLANSLKIGFGDLASATAFLTTQGNTASQATTQLGGMMSALINPSQKMADALKEMGYSSGRAAVENLGLVGTYQALIDKFGVDAVGPMIGQMEAVRGVTALTGDGFTDFSNKFVSGINGATAAAQQIQMDSPAAQFDLLKSKISSVGIEVGQTLLPTLNDLMSNTISPLIDTVMDWAAANPDATKTLVLLGGAAVIAGPIIAGLGFVIKGMGAALALVTSPAALLVGLIGGIVFAADKLYPGGLSKLLSDASTSARQLAIMGLDVLNRAARSATELVNGLVDALKNAAKAAADFVNNTVGRIQSAVGQGQSAIDTRTQVQQGLSTGTITKDQVWDQAYKSVSAEFGGGFGGSVAATFLGPLFANSSMSGQRDPNYNGGLTVSPIGGRRATGGDVYGGATGASFMVGEKGPEMLSMSPGTSGRVYSNEQSFGGGGSIQISGPFYFTAKSKAEAEEHAEAFTVKLDSLLRARG